MPQHYGNLFEDWEVAITKKLVSEFCQRWALLKREGFDDLMQECLTHWFFAKSKYDPQSKASMKTFMRRVVKNKLMKTVEKVYADKRQALYKSVSLDESIKTEEDIPASEEDTIKAVLSSELDLRIQKAFKKLSPKQKKICKLIYEDGLSINEASKHFKKHRSDIYREVARIRDIFEKEDLRDYLK
ncbi:MAG: sigma-70 family RNA polymerase sigma factor [Candidatus Omnitrophica bacterium]|nr:sigma-70 family RNA polymerase sigma factor [Candidatus Omnitrophota bacterium]